MVMLSNTLTCGLVNGYWSNTNLMKLNMSKFYLRPDMLLNNY